MIRHGEAQEGKAADASAHSGRRREAGWNRTLEKRRASRWHCDLGFFSDLIAFFNKSSASAIEATKLFFSTLKTGTVRSC